MDGVKSRKKKIAPPTKLGGKIFDSVDLKRLKKNIKEILEMLKKRSNQSEDEEEKDDNDETIH